MVLLKGFHVGFFFFFFSTSVCFAYETGHFSTLHPHSLLIQKGPYFLPLKQAAHSAKGKSQDALGQEAYRRSLEKKQQTNKPKNSPPQKSPPHQRVQSSRKRSNWDGNYELTSANYYFRTWICHASHLKSFSRVAIQFWPYSNITHRTAVLPCQKRNYRKPVWRIFYMITEIDLVGWLWSNSIVTLQL